MPISKVEVADDDTVGRVVITPQVLKRTERFLKRLGLYEEGTFGAHCLVGMLAYAQVIPQHDDVEIAQLTKTFMKNKLLLKRLVTAFNKDINLLGEEE